ncbi:MAG TPA: hypothetical protein VLT33_42535, partial [Labilithrix sp.]|nr:hypothetical protein [Labilithrix sp.]
MPGSPTSCSASGPDRRLAALLLLGVLAGCRRETPPAPDAAVDAAAALPARRPAATAPVDAADGGLLARKL